MNKQASQKSAGYWQPYLPADTAPWNLKRVVHLHRRAGFVATWNELQRDLADGPEASIGRVISGKARSEGVPAEFEQIAETIGQVAVTTQPERLKAWWIYRMLFSPDPLTERLSLVWHNHFATSNLKVNDLAAMKQQNELFRELGRCPFGELLKEVVQTPALLIWLDAPTNRKGQPNENLAREVMELFTLGIGNYSEKDIKEAARALTGWTVSKQTFYNNRQRHDEEEKTILGQTGRFDGDAFIEMLSAHPATSHRLAWRICQWLMGENVVSTSGLDELAAGLLERRLDIGWAVETVLRSKAFFAEPNLGTRVSCPLEFVVAGVRALELFKRPPSTLVLAEWATRMGQDLFYPPNVGGWSGGRNWLSTQTIVARANFAVALVQGELSPNGEPLDLAGFADRHGHGRDLEKAIIFFDQLFLGGQLVPEQRDRILASARKMIATPGEILRQAVALLLAGPAAQLA